MSVYSGVHCHRATNVSTPIASAGLPNRSPDPNSHGSSWGSPKLGSSSARQTIATAAEDMSSGMKYSAVSTERERPRPAAQTPSRTLTGVWVTTPSAVSSSISQMLCRMTGSENRWDQFPNPIERGEPTPDQLVNDSHTTTASGSSANSAKYTVAGTAQMMLGRPARRTRARPRRRATACRLTGPGFLRSPWATTAMLPSVLAPQPAGSADIAEMNDDALWLSKKVPTALWIGVICAGGHA